MNSPDISESDYDEKLREMGNYLWELDQDGDLAHQAGNLEEVAAIERKMQNVASKAERFRRIEGPHFALASLVKALALRMLKRWAEASQALLDVLEVNPLNGEAWLELTWALGEQEKWEDAALAARQGTEIFPEVSAAWGNLAEVLLHLDEREEAMLAVQKALQLDPADPRNNDLLRRIAHRG